MTAFRTDPIGRIGASARRAVPTLGSIMKPAPAVIYPVANYAGSTPPTVETVDPGGTLTPWTSDRFHYTGDPVQYPTAASCLFQTSPVFTAPTTNVEFVFSGVNVWIKVEFVTVTQPFQIYIDDYPVALAPTAVTVGVKWIKIGFAVNSTHTIRFVGGGQLYFYGVQATSRSTISKPARRFRLGYLADSHATKNNGVYLAGKTYYMAEMTGFDVYEMGQGTTGYITPGTAPRTPYGDPTRLAYLSELDLDALLISGSRNDGAPLTAAEVGAAATATYKAIADLGLNIPVYVAGVTPLNDNADYAAIDAAIMAAAIAAPNVLGFINWGNAGENWLTGTGNTAAEAFAGNQDFYIGADAAHASQLGEAYLAKRFVAALAPLPSALA